MTTQPHLDERKQEIIQRARSEYRDILPCAGRAELEECFTADHNRLCLWFNTDDDSTHMICVAL